MGGMKFVRYQCAHCGRRFEAEEKEIVECPGCFWTTSVKKQEETEAAEPAAGPSRLSDKTVQTARRAPFSFPDRLFSALAAAAAVGAVFILAPSIQNALKSRGLLSPPAGVQISPPMKQAPAGGERPPLERLSEEEKNILARRLEISADRAPSEEEQTILESRAPFQTGIVEKLPSQAWTLTHFKEMLAERERFYNVPLPGSYRGKLERLFTEKYLAADEAFKTGDLAAARDLWIESLAFPAYSKDIQKHRGVALTMLRPFINDTLSKIGAINSVLVERKIREKEQAARRSYEELFGLTRQKFWPEAAATVLTLDRALDQLENPGPLAGAPPPYPAAVSEVDAGIRATLQAISAPPSPAVRSRSPTWWPRPEPRSRSAASPSGATPVQSPSPGRAAGGSPRWS